MATMKTAMIATPRGIANQIDIVSSCLELRPIVILRKAKSKPEPDG
jgi:hypothetical protein